eukprot:CAMPEP_0117018602 /NCGR_PEP_ID=MMETSP0472-20121206/14367_1 /TAXON_ID=693140 ORGANISM="Tiarina fusus, Strain LIS" /NCGR_SAMPLE_ID=MMETSP0472 /ASSEMBLY_ACC=CAM_ASM_000603 /LENGTH=298 /DNA_ID=CAMNT_0004723305 /DNA_START=47 /DNA_END=940 /DNA_ORIENTATION=+
MRSPPLMLQNATASVDDDEAARAQAARAQRAGTDLVREHLEQHVQQNPGRSSDYVTWIATLHPENADVAVDQRFFIPGNPWWTVYEESKNNGPNIPTATAVPVLPAEYDEEHQQQQEHGSSNGKPQPKMVAASPHFCLLCSPVDLFAGLFVTVFAIFGVVLCEAFALFLCYIPAAIIYHLARTMHPPNICTGILYSALMIFYYAFALCDSICLLASVLVTECVAVAGYIVSLCTGGILMAKHWHQYIRRICHGIRILVRRCSGNNPPRTFLFKCLLDKKDEFPESVTEIDPNRRPPVV